MATKLELANHMLSTIGERAQVSLNTGHPSMIQAISILDSNNADFQNRCWWFNTERGITLLPNELGEIVLPVECTEFSLSRGTQQYLGIEGKTQYAQRGSRVYDNRNHTYTLAAPVVADLTLRLPIELLPEPASTYLKHLAALAMYENDDGDAQKIDRLEKRKLYAWSALQAAHIKFSGTNAFDGQFAQSLLYRINQTGHANLRAATESNPEPVIVNPTQPGVTDIIIDGGTEG